MKNLNKIKYYIGIDNGKNGGIVILDAERNVLEKRIMPVIGKIKKQYDINAISRLLKLYKKNSFVILEKAQPMFRDGKKQSFMTGYCFGMMQGILFALNMNFQIVAPKSWQKKIFMGMKYENTKEASKIYCMRKWQNVQWKGTPRCKKIHDGLTDACCMAEYGILLTK